MSFSEVYLLLGFYSTNTKRACTLQQAWNTNEQARHRESAASRRGQPSEVITASSVTSTIGKEVLGGYRSPLEQTWDPWIQNRGEKWFPGGRSLQPHCSLLACCQLPVIVNLSAASLPIKALVKLPPRPHT